MKKAFFSKRIYIADECENGCRLVEPNLLRHTELPPSRSGPDHPDAQRIALEQIRVLASRGVGQNPARMFKRITVIAEKALELK